MIAHAMWAVLGPAPKNPESLIGYNMAKLYFQPCIELAEPVYQGMIPPNKGFYIMMENAQKYSGYPVFLKMPKDTQRMIVVCTKRFFARYQEFVKKENSIAA